MYRRLIPRALVVALTLLFLLPANVLATGAEDDDFNNDSQDDFAIYRPTEGNWYIKSSEDDSTLIYQLGLPGDQPVHGNYDFSSLVDLAVYRPSNGFWFFQTILSDLTLGSLNIVQWGGFPGDVPVPCDFNGDSRMDLTIFRGGVWYTLFSSSYDSSDPDGVLVTPWGTQGDIPIPFDVDSDSTCDFVVYRQGSWFVNLSSKHFTEGGVLNHGSAGDYPVPGKYDSDDKVDLAVYREGAIIGASSFWIISESTTRGLTNMVIPWGQIGDYPVAKDVDDDGRTDIIVWRPFDGNWYTLLSSDDFAGVDVTQFGIIGDIPLGDRAGIDP